MLFTSFQTLLFVLSSAFLIVSVPRRLQKALVLILSIYYVIFIDIKLIFLLLLISFINYIGAKLLSRDSLKIGKVLVFTLVVLNIFFLFTFKKVPYLNSLFNRAALHIPFGQTFMMLLNTLIPLGLSFYIFKTISFLIDSYHKKIKSASLFDFLTYVFYFPQFVSGPIERFDSFINSVNGITLDSNSFRRGIARIGMGLYKKMVIADRLAPYINSFYSDPHVYGWPTLVTAILAYSFQLYFDFSGYSDIAIGVGLLLGIKAPENFNLPYLSTSVRDFWRRWHMTLSSWFRDYVYIPLGGSRKSKMNTYLNLLITFTLTGLWHGQSLGFLIWGLLHGFALCFERLFKNISVHKYLSQRQFRIIGLFFTFFFVTLAWIPFRASSIQDALYILKRLFIIKNGLELSLNPIIIGFSAILIILPVELKLTKKLTKSLRFAYMFSIATFFILFYIAIPQDFLYFKF